MLSFKASQLSKNVFVPIEGFKLCRYQNVIGRLDHSEDISDLPDIFTLDQKKLLKDPHVQRILAECDKETVVTFFNVHPTELKDVVCKDYQHFGLNSIVVVPQDWFEANPNLCLVCKGTKLQWDDVRVRSDISDNSDSVSLSSNEAPPEVPSLDEPSYGITGISVVSMGSGRVPDDDEEESIDITELIHELRSSESAREKREIDIRPRRQRNDRNGGDVTPTDVEYVPHDALQRIKDKLREARIPLYAFYRYPEPRVNIKEFGKTGERLMDKIWRIFQQETIVSPNFPSGIYIVEVWHKLCCASNPRVFDVPIKIINRPQND